METEMMMIRSDRVSLQINTKATSHIWSTFMLVSYKIKPVDDREIMSETFTFRQGYIHWIVYLIVKRTTARNLSYMLTR